MLAAATCVAALLRLLWLDSASLWFDETYTASVVGPGDVGAVWDRIGATESTPPLFYLLTWVAAQLSGDRGEAALRIVSALASIAVAPVAFPALRRLAGRPAALATAAILAVSPIMVTYAVDARAYALLALVSLLSVWAFTLVLERPSARTLALWGLAAAATIWTHWFGGFLVLAETVVLLWLRPSARRGTVLAATGVLASLLPLVPMLREQTGDDRANFITQWTIANRVEQLVREFAMGPDAPRTWLEAAGLTLFAAGAAAGTAIAARRALAARRTARAAAARPSGAAPSAPIGEDGALADGAIALLALLAIGLLVPLALAVTGLYDRFFMRNLLFLLPLAAAVVALGLLRLRGAPLAAYLALSLAAVVWVNGNWRYEHTDWRDAIAAVHHGDAGAGDPAPVLAVTDLGQPVVRHYLGSTEATAPLRARRVWLVVEPRRGEGQRDLRPLGETPADAALAPLFPTRNERVLDGFRIVELEAPAPVALAPGGVPGATLFTPAR